MAPAGNESLPQNWGSAVDAVSGNIYYYHKVTREVRWELPEVEVKSDKVDRMETEDNEDLTTDEETDDGKEETKQNEKGEKEIADAKNVNAEDGDGDSTTESDSESQSESESEPESDSECEGMDGAEYEKDLEVAIQMYGGKPAEVRDLTPQNSLMPDADCMLPKYCPGSGELALFGKATVGVPEEVSEAAIPPKYDTPLPSEAAPQSDTRPVPVRTLQHFLLVDEEGALVPFHELDNVSKERTVRCYGTLIKTPEEAVLRAHRRLIRSNKAKKEAAAVSSVDVSENRRRDAGRHDDASAPAISASAVGVRRQQMYGKISADEDAISREQAYADAQRRLEECPSLPITFGSLKVISLGSPLSEVAGTPCATYHNTKHIFPVGYRASRPYPCIVDPEKKSEYTSIVAFGGGEGPIFKVLHEDGVHEWSGRSASNVWLQVLRAVNDRKREIGIPARGTSISGTEAFGIAHAGVASMLEGLPGADKLQKYVFRAQRGDKIRGKVISVKDMLTASRTRSGATSKRKADSGASDERKPPKKPCSSYIIFSSEMRKTLNDPTMTFKERSAKTSELWKNMNDEERAKWDKLAAEDRQRYATELDEYNDYVHWKAIGYRIRIKKVEGDDLWSPVESSSAHFAEKDSPAGISESEER